MTSFFDIQEVSRRKLSLLFFGILVITGLTILLLYVPGRLLVYTCVATGAVWLAPCVKGFWDVNFLLVVAAAGVAVFVLSFLEYWMFFRRGGATLVKKLDAKPLQTIAHDGAEELHQLKHYQTGLSDWFLVTSPPAPRVWPRSCSLRAD